MSQVNSVYLESVPSYPYRYPHDLKCNWYVTAYPGHSFVVVRFPLFSLELYHDFLSIGYGHNITQNSTVFHLSGELAPASLTINSSSCWITFNTDEEGQRHGFEIQLQSSGLYGIYVISMSIFQPLTR